MKKRKGKYVQLEFDFKPWDDEVKCVSLASYRLFQREVWKDVIEEVWKDIKGYEGLYQVSNLGRVKSLNYNHTGKEKILKLKVDRYGYQQVGLCKNGKQKFYTVHRLVFEAFIGEIPEGMEVNHKDENKQNNVLSNIDTLMTHKENNNWGTHNERSAKNRSKSVVQKNLQGEVIKIWSSAREIQRALGYSHGSIWECCKGNRKKHKGYIWEYEEAV